MDWTRPTGLHLRLSRFCFVPPWVSSDRFQGAEGTLPAGAIPIRLKGHLEHIADVVGVDEVQSLALLLGDLLDVALVAIRHDHLLDPRPLSGERLLLQAS